jgi:hypothetical protein
MCDEGDDEGDVQLTFNHSLTTSVMLGRACVIHATATAGPWCYRDVTEVLQTCCRGIGKGLCERNSHGRTLQQ